MAIAILNIGYSKFALTPKQAAEIITLLSNAAQVSDAYDHDYARRDAPKNGDSYPCGQVAKISDSLKVITTTTGERFYRRHETGSWLKDGTWFLVLGHDDLRNPSF